MFGYTSASRALRTVVAAAALFAAGCGGGGSGSTSPGGGGGTPGAVNVDPAVLLTSITTAVANPLNIPPSLRGWGWSGFLTNFGTLLTNVSYTLEMQKITYSSTGADGRTQTMTGLLILPRPLAGPRPAVPILMYQHGTETFRDYSPSRFLANMTRPADYPEVMVAAAIASTGYAVAMADYEGLGDNTSTHPYVHGASLAQQVIDMLKASRTAIGVATSPCTWNNQLFLMGYSEGGYVTMATTRELQLNHAAEFTVTASAPLAGPHDLSGTMRTLMTSGITSKAPYFLPYVLTGYHYAYGAASPFNPVTTMVSPLNISIPPMFSGAKKSDEISIAMGMTFTPPVNLIVPRNVLTTAFASQLDSNLLPGSPFDFLRRNDSFRVSPSDTATWKPTVPLRMYHHRSDELVPYANSQVAFDAFSTAGAKNHVTKGPGVELLEEPVALTISPTDPLNTYHVGAAFPALNNGWKWLNGFKQ